MKEIKTKQKNLEAFDPQNHDYEMYTLHSLKGVDYHDANQHPVYSGKLFIRELVFYSGCQQINIMGFTILTTIVRGLIPYIVRYYQFGTFAGFEWDGIVFSVCEFFTWFI